MNKSEFEDRVERIPFSGCWIWLGAIRPNGTGRYCKECMRVRAREYQRRLRGLV